MGPVQATLLKLNAYGARWHVMTDKGVVFSAKTKRACIDYCHRRNLTITK